MCPGTTSFPASCPARSRPIPAPPATIDELFGRADGLAGRPLAWVASQVGWQVPADLRRNKGWIGQLLEEVLGATAGSKAEPDFPHLGVELKTLPVSPVGAPRESTYVCTLHLETASTETWETCWVRRKLSCVLWVPIVSDSATPLGQRLVGAPLLWRPSPEEEATLRADWEELTELVAMGELWQLDARRGAALQVRPKAADSAATAWAMDTDGEWVRANPRGFYLRARFTRDVLARAFLLPPR